jgi:large subunit ribosomal protein L21
MNSYAIVETGGKQLRVEPNQVIEIERLRLGKNPTNVVLDKVLLVGKAGALEVGSPYVKGASVVCDFLGETKGPKKVIFKMRRRKNYRRKTGHRQLFIELRVKEIQFQE